MGDDQTSSMHTQDDSAMDGFSGGDNMMDCNADEMDHDPPQVEEGMMPNDRDGEHWSSRGNGGHEVQATAPKLSYAVAPIQLLTPSEKISVEFFKVAQQHNPSRSAQEASINFFNECINSNQRKYISSKPMNVTHNTYNNVLQHAPHCYLSIRLRSW